jgi:hypothetical protein
MSTRPAGILCLLASLAAAAHGASEKALPPELARIQTVPASMARLSRSADIVREEGDDDADMPISVYYRPVHDDGSFMVVTDESLCKKPATREICDAFGSMLRGERPAFGDDVTQSRIGGSDYATIYLVPVDGVQLAGVDATMAFLGGDTQSDPPIDPVVYIYARRGTNLVQMVAPLGPCEVPLPDDFWAEPPAGKPARSDAQFRRDTLAYYRRACASPSMVAKARTAGRALAETYRLAH